MTVDVKVPVLAESVPDATLLEWRKQPGDAVAKDEILIELETDKVVLEVPAPEAGVLAEILKHAGDTVLSQEVLARINPGAAASAVAGSPATAASAGLAAVPEAAAPASPAGPQRLSPAVRRLVDEHGLDASAISGTGRDGRITKGDVLAHLEAASKPAEAAPALAAVPAASVPASEPARVPAAPTAPTPAPAPAHPRRRPSPPASRPRPPHRRRRRRPLPPAPRPCPRHPRRGAAANAANRCRGYAGASPNDSSRRSTPPRSSPPSTRSTCSR